MTRTLIFDVDGVLIHGYHTDPARIRPWDANLLADTGVDPDRFRSEFIFDIFTKKVIIGELSLVEALERRLPSLGYKRSPMQFIRYWLEHDSVLNQDLLASIRALKSRVDIRLIIATNQEHLRANWLFNHLRLCELFEDIFYSARVGTRKPDPAFYRFVDAKLGHQSQPPLFFDDSPAVIAGARNAGWEAVLFNDVKDFMTSPWVAQRLQYENQPFASS